MKQSIEHIPLDDIVLEGELIIPGEVKGIVIFAHGSGSSRHSPRNRQVAKKLQEAGLATLLVDLLSAEEDADPANRFDIALLANRLFKITDWVKANEQTNTLPVGYFGASTGAAAAMKAAAMQPKDIKAIVSRGGRVDLAQDAAAKLSMAVLFIVGGADYQVKEMNEAVLPYLPGEKRLSVVPNATHLFEEPGALEEVARLAALWFDQYLP